MTEDEIAAGQDLPGEQEGLGEFWAVYQAHYDEIAASLEAELADHPEIGPLLRSLDPAAQEEQRRRSRELIRRAIEAGEWEPYLADLREQGAAYARGGLSFGAWFAVVGALRRQMGPHLLDAYGDSHERLLTAGHGLSGFVDLALAAIGEAYLAEKERTIGEQQAAIRELSTPVLELRPGLLLLPLVGLIDSERARSLTGQLLRGIGERRARVVVLDVTGVPAVDTAVANHLIQTVQAARLMGATGLVSGLSPENAQTLVRLGLDLAALRTVGTLADAVAAAEQILRPAAGV